MGVVTFIILMVLAVHEYRSSPRPMPSVSELYDINRPEPPAPLSTDRKVVEQDCREAPVDPSANLKCR